MQPALPASLTMCQSQVASQMNDSFMLTRQQQGCETVCNPNGTHTAVCRGCLALQGDLQAERDQVSVLQKQLQASHSACDQLRSQLAAAKDDLSTLRSTLTSLASVRDQEKQDAAMKHLRTTK
jgi:septal ring factor EnvC (AmiA/AmiB activator)